MFICDLKLLKLVDSLNYIKILFHIGKQLFLNVLNVLSLFLDKYWAFFVHFLLLIFVD